MPGNAPPHTDERDLLLAYIAQQRAGLRNSAHGLTDEQARLTPTAGTLSIGGLIKHVATTEQGWIDMAVQRRRPPLPQEEQERNYHDRFRLREDETLAGVLAAYDDVARETEEAIAGADMDAAVPVPKGVPWFPAD